MNNSAIHNNAKRYFCGGKRQRCEVWTRVMGYHRPVDEFNKGKKAEYRDRKEFIEKPSADEMMNDNKKRYPNWLTDSEKPVMQQAAE